MSFLPLFGVLKSDDPTTQPKMGIVFDNNDPLGIGRVKATVEGMYTRNSAQWIRRMAVNPLGAGTGCEFFAVPEIGSKIWLVFPFGDDSFPYYTDQNPFGKFAHTEQFSEDYPYSYGFTDSTGFLVKQNKVAGTLTIETPDSYSITCGKGTVTISGKVDIVLDAPETRTTGSLSVGTGASGIVSAGGVSMVFSDGILTAIQS